MALTLDPQTQDFGDVNVAPNINVAVKESDNLNIKGEARIIDGAGTVVKTENWEATGKYTYTPNFSDKWDDMAEGASSVQLTVKSYEPIPEQPVYADRNSLYLEQTTFAYDGYTKTPVLHGYDSNKMTIYGDTSRVNPGKYYLKVKPREGYYWVNPQGNSDKYAELVFEWEITKARGYMTINGTMVYDGDSYYLTISELNTWKAVYIGKVGDGTPQLLTYPDSSIVKANINMSGNMDVYAYKNGNTSCKINIPASTYGSSVTVTMYIYVSAIQKINTVPYVANEMIENGNIQYPSWIGYDSNKLNARGDLYGSAAKMYSTYFSPKSGYVWYDNTSSEKRVDWEIKANLSSGPRVMSIIHADTGQEITPYSTIYIEAPSSEYWRNVGTVIFDVAAKTPNYYDLHAESDSSCAVFVEYWGDSNFTICPPQSYGDHYRYSISITGNYSGTASINVVLADMSNSIDVITFYVAVV